MRGFAPVRTFRKDLSAGLFGMDTGLQGVTPCSPLAARRAGDHDRLMSKPSAPPANQTIDYSNFASVVTGEGDWIPAGFPLPDGGFWQYREPDAVVIVQDGFLRVAAVPYSRGHDTIQFLDNAKHMYFSTRTFACPDGGTITFSIDLAATVVDGAPGDLYTALFLSTCSTSRPAPRSISS